MGWESVTMAGGCGEYSVVANRNRLLQGELDELEREEFFRLKKVQNKKKRDDGVRQAAVLAKVRI